MDSLSNSPLLLTHHMSMGVEYSVDPSSTSGGLYQRVTTSLEYVFVGTDLARARPTNRHVAEPPLKGPEEPGIQASLRGPTS